MSNSLENKHVVVIAFPFGSHPMPLLNLVLKLAHAAPKCSFSFISTEKSNATLFPKPYIPNNIKAYSINDGIPEGHVLGGHPVEQVCLFLKTGHENLHKGIDLALAETKRRVTCIISDAFVTSSLIVAQTLNVPWVPVWFPMSCSLSLYFYIDLIREQCANSAGNRNFNFLPGLSKMRAEDMPLDILYVGEEETVFSRTLVSLGRVLPQAKAVVINFFLELEPPEFVQDMRSKLQSMLYVVPLPSPLLPSSDTDTNGCLSWLDKQKVRSVAYVCFGTVVTPPPHEINAVAEALEDSGFSFLWSLKEHQMGLLPNGFLERTNMRGKIVSWAPQSQVLAHESVGVFVTHCGCNSVTESICNGVPMICRPFFGDQGTAARMIQDVWEFGVIIEGRKFNKSGLIKSLNLIQVQEEGKKIRDNALKVKKTLQDAARPEGQAAQDFMTLVDVISES
ncbi:anthocyanidin 3-O-glucosyltransferase 7-like [Gastrolobium bilobum]|uniref:anthocyanidin 3-O-glucosyltransferase 7-like n=1 Tax=Gastrolobium bilobum TaxID=150636 RepID=UPI002AAF1920|nr:anthocyanidin 3-O-glucosyltransferase 7-like [Gastrolobium bilobum]